MTEEVLYKSEPTLGDKVDRLTEMIESGATKPPKIKKFSLPWKGKLSNAGLRKGLVTVMEIGENNTVTFSRHEIIDSTIKLKKTFHAVNGDDLLTYKGKPLVVIPKKSSRPYNPNTVDNDTYSQKHIMSRMMNEVIGTGKKIGMMGISIGAIVLIGVVAYAFIAG